MLLVDNESLDVTSFTRERKMSVLEGEECLKMLRGVFYGGERSRSMVREKEWGREKKEKKKKNVGF